MTTIKLKRGKQESLLRGHPWIFSGAIHSATDEVQEGELVEVVTSDGQFIARGHCAIGSIAVRVLSFVEQEQIDQPWWNARVAKALKLREILGFTGPQSCYRLVHGEGDNMSGLVIDFYAGVAVVQCHSVGMFLCCDNIVEALKQAYGEQLRAVYNKSATTLPPKSEIEATDGYLFGDETHSPEFAVENGHKFLVNWQGGQKTGFFLDQRQSRALVEHYAHGRRVLNTFCYTGGFSVYALAGGAVSCDSVDSSEKAISLATRNLELNMPCSTNHQEVCSDTMNFLRDMQYGAYDLVILDPPAYAKHQNALGNALQGYKRLNARAMEKMAPGSLLFTFSCSQAVSRDQFRTAVFSAAAMAGRQVQILHQLSQSPDHPINIYHPEGEYLKGLVLIVN